ncbi:MAG TPA: SIMPL domain-containing protein [Firmicutes bacterium]|nr:SIMPL domain-containing protein [Bacillota bacterium]
MRQKLSKIGFVLILLVAVAIVVPVQAQAAEAARTITTYGEAQVSAAPDQANVTFGVDTEAATAQEALRANAAKMNQVLNALKGQGIPEAAIRTSGFSLYPNYEYVREGNWEARRLVGYRVSNSVRVETTDLENLGKLIDSTVTAGANVVSGISFSIRDTEKLEREALALAVKHARTKAEVLAGSAGGSITGIIAIEESGSAGFEPLRLEKAAAADMAGAVTPIEPGQIQLTTRVQVTFSYN